MRIASVQMPNSLRIEDNFNSVMNALGTVIKARCDLVVFPECSLSGFTSEMKKCSMDFLSSFLDQVKEMSFQNDLTVVLPSAYVKDEKVYYAIFIFDSNKLTIQYKIGLTESEKRFFSIPEKSSSKVFTAKGIRIGVLVCFLW